MKRPSPARAANSSLGGLALIGIACGQVSNDPNGISNGDGRSQGTARAGSAGGASSGVRVEAATQAGRGGSGAVDAPDAGDPSEGGEGGAAGGSVMSGAVGSPPQLPADCPEITPIAAPGQQLVIRSMNFITSEIVLQNVSDENIVILGQRNGWQWCNFPAYWTINEANDVELSPGETFSFVAVYNATGPRQFDPEGGELGIYTTTGSFTTAELMRAFVSWGDVISQREPTAVQAGYWVFDERIALGPRDDGFVIVGESDRADGYRGVREACLASPPNED